MKTHNFKTVRRYRLMFLTFSLLLAFTSACSTGGNVPTNIPTLSPPAPTSTPIPTNTIIPPTNTPEPTATEVTYNWVSKGSIGGVISDIVFDPVSSTTIYAGFWSMNGNGIFKSTDSGENWVNILANKDIYTLAIDPATPSNIYTGGFGFGVYKSTDSGKNWSAINNGMTGGTVFKLVIDPESPATLYAGTRSGVFKSLDQGENWVNIGLTDIVVKSLVINPESPSTLYAGTRGSGVFKSIDGGTNWTNVGILPNNPDIEALVIDPISPETVYLGAKILDPTSGANYSGGIYKSTDGGVTWIESILTQTQVYALVIDPETPSTLYAATSIEGVIKTTNGGDNWKPIGPPYTNIYALAIDPSTPSHLYLGTSEGEVLINH